MFRRSMSTLVLALFCASSALALSTQERRDFMDAIRPEAVRQAGQDVRFKVDHLNQDGDWVVLVGSVVGAPGKTIDWSLSPICGVELDKILWVVARRAGAAWQVKHMLICASEPPYWNLEPYGGLVWPCGVYADMKSSEGEDLEPLCRKQRSERRPARR
jgi:hypothetical protein